jgi:hypothetical protein
LEHFVLVYVTMDVPAVSLDNEKLCHVPAQGLQQSAALQHYLQTGCHREWKLQCLNPHCSFLSNPHQTADKSLLVKLSQSDPAKSVQSKTMRCAE